METIRIGVYLLSDISEYIDNESERTSTGYKTLVIVRKILPGHLSIS